MLQGTQSRGRMPLIAAVIVLIIALGGLGLAYDQSSSTVSALDGQLASLQSQLKAAQDNISTLRGNVTSLQALSSVDNGKIASEQSQVSSLQSQTASDQGSIANLTARVTGLQGQVTGLQAITSLSLSTVQLANVRVNESAGSLKQLGQFVIQYPGYLLVTGNASTQNGYIGVDTVYPSSIHSQSGQSVNFMFGSNGDYEVVIPVLPGTIVLYYGNFETSGTVEATVTVTYGY